MTEPASGEGSSPEPVILPTSVPQVEAPVVEVPEPSAGMLPSMELEVPTAPVAEIPVSDVPAAEVESADAPPRASAPSPTPAASTPTPAPAATPSGVPDIKSRQPAAREKVQARTRARLEKIMDLAKEKSTIKNDVRLGWDPVARPD